MVAPKEKNIERIIDYCNITSIKPNEINGYLDTIGSSAIQGPFKISELIARPGISLYGLAEHLSHLKDVLEESPNRKDEIREAAEIKNKI